MSDKDEKKDALATTFRMPVKKVGIAAKLEKAKAEGLATVNEMEHRIGIVYDDSGSMGAAAQKGSRSDQARQAAEAFLVACNPKNTAIAVYPMNPGDGHQIVKLTNLYAYISSIVQTYDGTGGTPLYPILKQLLNENKLTRAVVFSDGFPDSLSLEEDVIGLAISQKVPVDTVYIGEGDSPMMKRLAERTGGMYISFKPGVSFGQAFKYLAPAYRALLADDNFKAKVERGEV